MDGLLKKVVFISIALTVLMLLLNSIVMPNYNTTGSFNNTVPYNSEAWNRSLTTYTGMSNSTYQGLLLLVFLLGIIGIALAFFPAIKVKLSGR